MELIRSHDTKLRVANFPPPLVTDHRHVERIGGRDSALHIVNRARRSQNKHKDDQNWDHGPGELDLIAAIDLRRLTNFIPRPPPKPNDGVGEQTADDQKNCPTDRQGQQGDFIDRLGRRGQGFKDAGHSVGRGGERRSRRKSGRTTQNEGSCEHPGKPCRNAQPELH